MGHPAYRESEAPLLGEFRGTLKFEPNGAAGSGRRRGWVILVADRDWYAYVRSLSRHNTDGRWVTAVDRSRMLPGLGSPRPDMRRRLAWLREVPDPPAWGPHISIVRGETPRVEAPTWRLLAEITEASDRLAWSRREIETLTAAPEPPADEIGRHRRRIAEQGERLARAMERWDRVRAPGFLEPGVGVRFSVTSVLRGGWDHWFYDVRCPDALALREHFGLGMPRVPLHLTVAVMGG